MVRIDAWKAPDGGIIQMGQTKFAILLCTLLGIVGAQASEVPPKTQAAVKALRNQPAVKAALEQIHREDERTLDLGGVTQPQQPDGTPPAGGVEERDDVDLVFPGSGDHAHHIGEIRPREKVRGDRVL